MSRNGKLEPMEVETMMNEARMLNNIIEVGERMIVSDKMEEARSKHDGREKSNYQYQSFAYSCPRLAERFDNI